jgi:uncharacterized protein
MESADTGGAPPGRAARRARERDALGRPLPWGVRGVPPVDDRPRAPAEALGLAQTLLDAGRPFQAHEVLEAVWKAAPADERDLWRGLAQLAVGVTHVARGNPVGAAALLRRAADRLTGYATRPAAEIHGVDAAGLAAWSRNWAEHLTAEDAAAGTGAGAATLAPRLRADRAP